MKKFIAILIIVLTSIANAQEGRKFKLTEDDCMFTIVSTPSRDIDLRKEFNSYWSGECKDGLIEGSGVFTFRQSTSYFDDEYSYEYRPMHYEYIYTGNMVKGKMSGKGILRYSISNDDDKDNWHLKYSHVGMYNNGMRNGHGISINSDGKKFVGEFRNASYLNGNIYNKNGTFIEAWKNGVKQVDEGFANYTLEDGSTYSGEWNNSKQHGRGSIIYASGAIYIGEWIEGEINGYGTFTSTKGTTYVGEWQNRKQHGKGTLTWSNGTNYVGEFKGGKMHGQGTLTWSEGDKFVGVWVDDKRNGQGTFFYANGKTSVGKWKDDKEVKRISNFENK